jgi:hypothetical protein
VEENVGVNFVMWEEVVWWEEDGIGVDVEVGNAKEEDDDDEEVVIVVVVVGFVGIVCEWDLVMSGSGGEALCVVWGGGEALGVVWGGGEALGVVLGERGASEVREERGDVSDERELRGERGGREEEWFGVREEGKEICCEWVWESSKRITTQSFSRRGESYISANTSTSPWRW